MNRISMFLICFLAGQMLMAQPSITLENPSFESDLPRHSLTPEGWLDCGEEGESPPDVQPNGIFGRDLPEAFEGDTYLSMVTRDNNTVEAIMQKLATPLLKGVTYKFSVSVFQSDQYISQSRITNSTANYVAPAILELIAGNSACAFQEILGKSDPIKNAAWSTLTFTFTPKKNYQYFGLKLNYAGFEATNGHVMLDHCSAIVPTK
jgi:hypothetical protein